MNPFSTKASRRTFLKTLGNSSMLPFTALTGIPSLALAGNRSRRFLFVFCDGAWDTSMVFAPEMLNNQHVYTDRNDTDATVQGLQFIDGVNRPEVRQFFEQWGDRCCIINGLDFETVAHDRAKRILMTGSAVGTDDWGACIGANSPTLYTAPHLHLSGPNYSTQFSNAILRVGNSGELHRLLYSEDSITATPTTDHDNLVNAYLRRQASHATDESSPFVQDFIRSHTQLADLKDRRSQLNLPDGSNDGAYGYDCNETFMGQAQVALDFFQDDLSRCAIVQDEGFCRMRWDSHGDYFEQNWHYDLLFLGLQQLMTELQTRQNIYGIPLIEETTVIVCSEMSRHPRLNEMGGKHHWPVGSAMVIGGVTGGRTIGGYDDQVLSRTVDLQSAELSSSGVKLQPKHLGATLLAMADLDPIEFLGVDPLWGILS